MLSASINKEQKMSAFTICDKNFGPTWKKVEPYVNFDRSFFGNERKANKLRETAHKAVYTFLCNGLNRGFFKVGLDAHIRALDKNDVDTQSRMSRMNKMIDQALDNIRDDMLKSSDSVIRISRTRISPLIDLARIYMQEQIGYGWLFSAKFSPSRV